MKNGSKKNNKTISEQEEISKVCDDEDEEDEDEDEVLRIED